MLLQELLEEHIGYPYLKKYLKKYKSKLRKTEYIWKILEARRSNGPKPGA